MSSNSFTGMLFFQHRADSTQKQTKVYTNTTQSLSVVIQQAKINTVHACLFLGFFYTSTSIFAS